MCLIISCAGLEESGEARERVEVTEGELPGHMALEMERASVERRPPRRGYKDVPLTGCHQSVLPLYRLPADFGQITPPDERGLFREEDRASVGEDRAGRLLQAGSQPWVLDDGGRVLGLRLPNGEVAGYDDILRDARAWATAFGRDVRAVFCQNHDHNCVATCAKYAQKSEGDQQSGHKMKKLDPRSYCRFLFVRIVEMKVGDKIKKVLRRGKALLQKACVCRSNIRNEYGRVGVVRRHPFRSTSNDVLQAFGRCNVDIQRNDRVVPSDVPEVTVEAMKPVRFFYGQAQLSAEARQMLAALAEGIRSSHICDFYMTKYLAKGQQVLASAITPVLAGLNRLDDEIAAGAKTLPTIEDVARAKLRRILFSANRAHWFSACELAIFVLTGGHSIATHVDRPLFLSKVFYLLEEGKRLRNGALLGSYVAEAARPSAVDVVQFVEQAQTKRSVDDVGGTPTERDAKRSRTFVGSDLVVGDASMEEPVTHEEMTEGFVDVPDGLEEDVELVAGEEIEETEGPRQTQEIQPEEPQVRMFRATASTFDDWLHRGFFLQDMNFHTYVAHIEVAPRSQGKLGDCFLFDEHYVKSKTYWQRLARRIAVPRVVGAACSRLDVGNGEENARYKLTLFGLLCCPGTGACADPVSLSRPYLFPGSSKSMTGRGAPVFLFGPAWKARRAEVERLADEAERKIKLNKKLPTLVDCATFRCLQSKKLSLVHVLVRQVFYYNRTKNDEYTGTYNFCKLVAAVCSYLDVDSDLLFAEEQLHLCEFVGHRTRDMVLRLDMHTEARNTAIQVAKDKVFANVEEDAASVASDDQQVLIEVENVGGEPEGNEEVDQGENIETGTVGGVELTSLLPQDPDAVRAQLLHSSVLDPAKESAGRKPDAVRFMLDVEKALPQQIQVCKQTFPVSQGGGWEPQTAVEDLLVTQQQYIDLYRQTDQTDGVVDEGTVGLGDPSREPSVEVVPGDLRSRGPAVVAKMLCDRAGLNRDQLGFVAIVAKTLQDAFDRLPVGSNGCLPKDEVLLRCLLVGGGGCGKTRIINMVLRPLFETVFGDGSMQAQAPSNKAARQIQGRTMHSANKLRKDSSLRTVHLRVTAETKKALECNTVPLAAIVIDEFSQCIGQMLHADALRKSYGRQQALGLEIHRYAEFDETWGRMPVVVIAGDELQLPPVPFAHSLLASTDGTSDEHKAGVHLFSQFQHVYRLQTAMRFQDPVLECILKKMRTPGGSRLTQAEWKALLATNVAGPSDADRLVGTEHFFQACYTWSVVSLAYVVRSFESAKASKQTLYAVRAVDIGQNIPPERGRSVAEALVRHPNMNETGRLPHYGLYHIGMEVRFTQTVAAPHVVVDTAGVIRGFAFAKGDADRTDLKASFVVLRQFPEAIYVELKNVPKRFMPEEPCREHAPNVCDTCSQCLRLRNIFLVRPFTNQQAWSLKLAVANPLGGGTEEISVKVKRTQIPLVTVKASTLHVLQGTTTEPGLIFHWQFPRRLQGDMRWLAAYVALSRVRSLTCLRSVGLDGKVRALIEEGPPDTLPARFQQLFEEKELNTQTFAAACLVALGW